MLTIAAKADLQSRLCKAGGRRCYESTNKLKTQLSVLLAVNPELDGR